MATPTTPTATPSPNGDCTPGPFTVEETSHGTLLIMSDAEPDAIAEMPFGGEPYEPRRRANAALFASAPKLVDALSKVADIASNAYNSDDIDGKFARIGEIAESALFAMGKAQA